MSDRNARRCALALVSLCLLLGAWAFWLEPASLRNEDHDLHLERWPRACDGLRIAILADLHVGSPFNHQDKLRRIVATTNAAGADLILLAGDYVIHGVVGGEFVTPEEIAKGLSGLSAPAGVFAVLGNHDWWLDGPRVRRALEAAGIPVLEDESRSITAGDCRFWLAGIGDWWTAKHDVTKALAGIPAGEAVVAFTHNPDVFPEVPDTVALTIAGHTHGGQVYLPGIGRPKVPSQYGERYAAGHVIENGRSLFVSTGLGTSLLPVRFLVPPEISVIRLCSKTV